MAPVLGACLAFALALGGAHASDEGIVVGVLTQPTEGQLRAHGAQFSKSKFTKLVEAQGLRVVPVPYDAPDSYLEALFKNISGLYLPGGQHSLVSTVGTYVRTARKLVKMAEADCRFPIIGNCLAMETLLVAYSLDPNITSKNASDVHVSKPLLLTPAAAASRLLGGAPWSVHKAFTSLPIAYNHHPYGVMTATFDAVASLRDNFNVLAEDEGAMGRYVTVVEHKRCPIWAVQFELPSTQFSWDDTAINHSQQAVESMQYLGNVWAEAARRSGYNFPVDELPRARMHSFAEDYVHCSDGCFFDDSFLPKGHVGMRQELSAHDQVVIV